MTPLYPLRFVPIYKDYLWGGRKFGHVLARQLEPDRIYAESWEVADLREGQSLVEEGPLRGTSLHQLAVDRGQELLGRHHPKPRFPLLLKYLDASRRLSVQVHPALDLGYILPRLCTPPFAETRKKAGSRNGRSGNALV